MPSRVSPLKDALQHVSSKTDKTRKLEVKYINAVKGRGVFALAPFSKGEFVLEYRGDMIDDAESHKRQRIYHPSCAAFMFSFKWRGKTWCIDASREDESLGRLVNDEHNQPNSRMKKIDVDGRPHLCLFALHDIQQGKEITYDYGGEDCPWRMQMTSNAASVFPVDSSHPPLQLETQMDEALRPQNTNQQMTSNAASVFPVDSSHPPLQLETQMDEALHPQNTNQQMTSNAASVFPVDSSHPPLQLETQMDEALHPQNTNQQMTSNAASVFPVDSSHPPLQLETQMDEALHPQNTNQQMTSNAASVFPVDSSHPPLQLETQMDEALHPQNTNQQMTSNAASVFPVDSSHPPLQLETQMDEALHPQNTNQQMTSNAASVFPVDSSHPPLQLETQMDEALHPQNTNQQMTSNAASVFPVDSSHPPLQLETQMDEALHPQNTNQQMTSNAASVFPVDSSHPPLQLETQMDEALHPQNTNQQIGRDFQNEEEPFLPRLRRTKSVIMKDTCLEDSDELYDSTSSISVSADEYVPDSASETDESDAELKPSQPLDDLFSDIGSVIPPVCDTTTPDLVTSTSTSEVTDGQQPCSSQDIVVNASQNSNGKRVYNKRHYCMYCNKPFAKMARHLESAHQNKVDVARALSFPKNSRERRIQLDYIRNKGNYAHNAAVLESGKGELVPTKRPRTEAEGKDFMHCEYCQGLFRRKVLWRHIRGCKVKPKSVPRKPGQNRVQSMCRYMAPVPSHVTDKLWKVISSMQHDPVTDIIKNDNIITNFGQHLLSKGGMSDKNQQCVREKMRELGRLVYNAKRGTTLKKMEDFINPKNYLAMVKAVKLTCGYDSDTGKFSIPSLANKLGNALVKVSKLLKAQGLMSDNQELVRNATKFQEVHSEKWNEMVSATALRNITEAKWNVPTLMPFTEDVQKLHKFLSQMQNECSKSLTESPSTKAWTDLAKVCLTQTILFNRRREGEVASMPLSAFLSRDTSDPHQDLDWALSEVEKQLCRHFSRIVIRGKRGRPVPVLLTPTMLCALELLVRHREACGVLKDNIYMFARPAAMTHIRGSDCIRNFAKACGAKCPESLRSTKLRKHAATLSTVLNMTDTEMDQLANFLGHNIRVHREFYRLPEKTLQLAKISKVLMALEQGRLAEFHGKNLDEVTIGPDEKVLCSDEEDENSQEGDFSSTVNEPLAVESLSPAVNEALPRHRPPSPEEAVSPGVSAKRPSSKGKVTKKRTPWEQTEVRAVEKHMKQFITSCIVPGKRDCEKCLRAEPEALKYRDWQNIKFYIHNRITAYKKKVQRT